jgi:DNA-binding MarR family transcriptional regulator
MGKGNKASVPLPGEGKRGLEGYLGYLLRQAAGVYRYRVDRALNELNVTQPQFAVLTMLAAYPGSSNAELARVALLTPQTVNVIIANLQKAGAIERRRHKIHGRILQIDLTAHGRDMLKQARTRVHALERELSRGLSQAEERIVRRWLAEVAKSGDA